MIRIATTMCLLVTGLAALAPRAPAKDDVDRLREWCRSHRTRLVQELSEMVAIPSVSERPADVARLAQYLTKRLERLRFTVEDISRGGPPLLLASDGKSDAKTTIRFYVHYDGQNVDPGRWTSSAPFERPQASGSVQELHEHVRSRASADLRLSAGTLRLVIRGLSRRGVVRSVGRDRSLVDVMRAHRCPPGRAGSQRST